MKVLKENEILILMLVTVIVAGILIGAVCGTARLRFYRNIEKEPIIRRSPFLVHLTNVCCIFYIIHTIIENLAYSFGGTEWYIDAIAIRDGEEEVGIPQITKIISVIFYILSIEGMFIFWVARSWIIYFNIQHGVEVQVKLS